MTNTPPAVRLEPEQLREIHESLAIRDLLLGVQIDFDALLSHIAALESELVEAKAKVEWRPIETAPKDGTRVMLGWPGGGVRYGFYLNNTNWKGWRGPSMELPFPSPPPTHWVPLPPPPQTSQGEKPKGDAT
jgi:hypothetical protein